MTDDTRDEPTRLAPTCPVCASRDKVERQHPHWHCVGCNTLFTGAQGEWERTHAMRELYQSPTYTKAPS